MWGHLGFLPGPFGLVIWSLTALLWFAVAVVVGVLVVLLARFLWFGTRAAKVYLEEHGRSSRFSLYDDRPAQDGGAVPPVFDGPPVHDGPPMHDGPPVHAQGPDAHGRRDAVVADDQPTTPYPAGGWPDPTTERLPQVTPPPAGVDPEVPPASTEVMPEAPQPRTPMRPRAAAPDSAEDDRPTG